LKIPGGLSQEMSPAVAVGGFLLGDRTGMTW
jgi:hypothetical protein